MAGPPSHDTTNFTIQDLLYHSLAASTHFPASAATFVNVQAAAVPQDSAVSHDTTFSSQAHWQMTHTIDMPRDDYYDEDTDKSNSSEDDEANAPIKTADGKWRCGWFDKKKQTRCDKVRKRMCDLT
jgi:hypothetical protein